MNYNKLITWNLAGAFCKHSILMNYFKKNNLFDRYDHINVYDGIEHCKWNGGRINLKAPYSDEVRDTYLDLGWSINITFSNPNIDTSDPVGNFILEKMHQEGNGIILVSDDLRRYIKKNFPKYKIYYSTTGCNSVKYPMSEANFSFYENVLDTHDFLIPRCDSNFDARLRELDLSRLELLVSDRCVMNCPKRQEHYSALADYNLKGVTPKDVLSMLGTCLIPEDEAALSHKLSRRILGDKYPFHLFPSQIKNLMDEGFRSFKVHGRDSEDAEYTSFLDRYLVDYNLPLEIIMKGMGS